jgi:hypothetical protein
MPQNIPCALRSHARRGSDLRRAPGLAQDRMPPIAADKLTEGQKKGSLKSEV